MTPALNKPLPEIEAQATGGVKFTANAFLGKSVVLYFYPKDNTPGCTTEAMQFRDRHKDFVKAGAVVFGLVFWARGDSFYLRLATEAAQANGVAMPATAVVSQLLNSLVSSGGVVIAICSVGLSLIFGTTGLTNFAHGELVTFGGVVAHLLSVGWGLNFIVASVLTVVLGGCLGLALNKGLWLPLRRRGIGLISQMVVSVGLSIILLNFLLMRFGGATRRYAAYNAQTAMSWGPIDITPRDLTTTIISVVVLIGVALVLQRSRLGKATRAVSDNVDLASSTGIDSEKIIRIVWFLGSALAALGGIVRGLDEGVRADMGGGLLFLMFAGITLGGLGSAYGALVGGFVIGVFVEASTIGIPIFPDLPLLGWIKHGVPTELKNVPALAALILILLFRPQGILGKKERVG